MVKSASGSSGGKNQRPGLPYDRVWGPIQQPQFMSVPTQVCANGALGCVYGQLQPSVGERFGVDLMTRPAPGGQNSTDVDSGYPFPQAPSSGACSTSQACLNCGLLLTWTNDVR